MLLCTGGHLTRVENAKIYVGRQLKLQPASMRALSRATGLPTIVKLLDPSNAWLSVGVTSPQACCHPTEPVSFAVSVSIGTSCSARIPRVMNVVFVTDLDADILAAPPVSLRLSAVVITWARLAKGSSSVVDNCDMHDGHTSKIKGKMTLHPVNGHACLWLRIFTDPSLEQDHR